MTTASAIGVGATNITTLGTITTGVWNAAVVTVPFGGTGVATLTTAYGLLAAGTTATGNVQTLTTGTSGQLLQSGGNAALPAWTTATFPGTAGAAGTILRSNGTNWVASTATFADTYTASNLLYSNGSNTVTGLATANNGVLTTGATGVPVITALSSDGQLIIGSSAGAPLAATLTAGTGVTITNGHNSITINATAAGSNWIDQTSTPVTLVANTSYSANNAGLVTFNMPATVAFGSVFTIVGEGAGGWLIQMNTGQVGHLNSSATTSAGSFASTERYDSISLVCTVANTTFVAISSSGVITNA